MRPSLPTITIASGADSSSARNLSSESLGLLTRGGPPALPSESLFSFMHFAHARDSSSVPPGMDNLGHRKRTQKKLGDNWMAAAAQKWRVKTVIASSMRLLAPSARLRAADRWRQSLLSVSRGSCRRFPDRRVRFAEDYFAPSR